jgi:zinc/manganese transport system permease protein
VLTFFSIVSLTPAAGLAALHAHQAQSDFPSPPISWNLFDDIQTQLQYAFMQNAYLAGAIVAVVAGVVGYFVVLRGLSFAGHALSHIGFAGATGAVALSGVSLFGIILDIPAVFGLLVFTVVSAVGMGILGKRIHGRDVAIGIVLAWALGLGVLFLSLYSGYATEAYALLFGEILGISVGDVVITVIAGAITLIAVAALYRPLLFASFDDEVAEARGVPVRFLSIAFMVILALAVSEAVQVVGVLLIFALLVTPAAIAERLTARPGRAIAISILLALGFTWVGLFIAYYLPYPVSFFITSLAFGSYVLVRLFFALRGRFARRPQQAQALEGQAA